MLGPFLSKDALSKFPVLFFAFFFLFSQIFTKTFPYTGMRSLPNIFPSVEFQILEMLPTVVLLHFLFSFEKKEEKLGKKRSSTRMARIGLHNTIYK